VNVRTRPVFAMHIVRSKRRGALVSAGATVIVPPRKLPTGKPLGSMVKFLLGATIAMVTLDCGKVSCKIRSVTAVADVPVFTIQPTSNSPVVQVDPLLLGHRVTAVFCRTASVLANWKDDVHSLTAERVALVRMISFHEGSASAAKIPTSAKTTIDSMRVKPRAEFAECKVGRITTMLCPQGPPL
jgi:hypothetical protein